MKVRLQGSENIISFTEDSDGWFINTEYDLAINPSHTLCITHPWYADYICEPPQHKFEIIEDS